MANPSAPSDKNIRTITHGCRLNSYESEVMRDHAEAGGLRDTVIINTCTVTSEAVRQSRQSVRRARRDNPDAKIIVTGCSAQIDPDTYGDMAEVDIVLGNDEKMQAGSFDAKHIQSANSKIRVSDIMEVRKASAPIVDGLEGRARAFVNVQTGCDHRCTFCIIPYGRGNARSVPAEDVVTQVKRLVETGHKEVVLTGVDLTSWGTDLPEAPELGALVSRILKMVPDLPWLRLSSIDAIEMDELLFEIASSEPRFTPYLHLSLQAGDDMILKRMKRRHLRDDVIDMTSRLKSARPDIAFGADLIAGFPTETDEMFQKSLDIVRDCRLSFLHVFPYSPRPGTPAARIPPLNGAIVKQRAAKLRAAGASALTAHLNGHVGKTQIVLTEKGGRGRLSDFTQVTLPEDTLAGTFMEVHLECHDGQSLKGAPV